MAESDREISLTNLAKIFAGNELATVERINDSVAIYHTPNTDGMHATLRSAARRGALRTRGEGLHQYTTPAAVAAWMATLPEQATRDIHSLGWAWLGDAWPVTSAPSPRKDSRQTGKREKQIQTIEATARALEYDPLDIPELGRAAIKAHCLEHHFGFFTESGFNHAWKEANRQRSISIHGKDRYLAR